jgi:hypothetical protein
MRIILLIPILLAPSLAQSDRIDTAPLAIYDPNPEHPWNRLYHALYLRGFESSHVDGGVYAGIHEESLDPLLWVRTKYLIQTNYQEIIALLDDLIANRADELIQDPTKRAFMQRDLWAVFDWAYSASAGQRDSAQGAALLHRLAVLMKRLALPREQIDNLTDNYAAKTASSVYSRELDLTSYLRLGQIMQLEERNPNWNERFAYRKNPIHFVINPAPLPKSFNDPSDVWALLSNRSVDRPLAISHAFSFSGRSTFLCYVRFPAGREEAAKYLSNVNEVNERESEPAVSSNTPVDPTQDTQVFHDPDLPDPSIGTQFALVRRMNLIDPDGQIVASPLVETVQLRIFDEMELPSVILEGRVKCLLHAEYRVNRQDLFAGKAVGLRSISAEDREYRTLFNTHGIDMHEFDPVLQFCADCHSQQPRSLLNRRNRFNQSSGIDVTTSDAANEANVTARFKAAQADWQELMRLWQDGNPGTQSGASTSASPKNETQPPTTP